MNKLLRSFFAAVVALQLLATLGAGTASAQTIYAVGTDDTFGSFNLATRQYTQISASLGGGNTYNLTLNSTGSFYGTQNAGVTNDTFVGITTTGTVAVIGAPQGMGDAMHGLARRADGTLFGYGGDTSTVGTVNPATGVYTYIGNAGMSAAGFGGDLAFSGSTLYAISSNNNGSLHTVNTTTGALSTQIGASNANYTNGAVFSSGAGLYVLQGLNLFSANTTTGTLTLLGALTGTGSTTGFYAASAVPEPSTWAILSLIAVRTGVVVLRRRCAA